MELKVDTISVVVPVDGVPPKIVQRMESIEPVEAVEVLVNVSVLPMQTVVSLAVKEAVGVGVVVGVLEYLLKNSQMVWQ